MIPAVFESKLTRYEMRIRQHLYDMEKAMKLLSAHPASDKEIPVLMDEVLEESRYLQKQSATLMMLQAPVARDMERVSADLEIFRILEKTASNILSAWELCQEAEVLPLSAEQKNLFLHSAVMCRQCAGSLRERRKQELEQVMEMDTRADSLYESCRKSAVEKFRGELKTAEQELDLLMAAKYAERICDHLVSICQLASG